MMKRRSLFCLVLSLSLLFLCAAASAGDYLALPDPGAYFGVAAKSPAAPTAYG